MDFSRNMVLQYTEKPVWEQEGEMGQNGRFDEEFRSQNSEYSPSTHPPIYPPKCRHKVVPLGKDPFGDSRSEGVLWTSFIRHHVGGQAFGVCRFLCEVAARILEFVEFGLGTET